MLFFPGESCRCLFATSSVWERCPQGRSGDLWFELFAPVFQEFSLAGLFDCLVGCFFVGLFVWFACLFACLFVYLFVCLLVVVFFVGLLIFLFAHVPL